MKLGRIANFDDRSRNYSVRRLAPVQQPKTTFWNCSLYLDQGMISSCVGNAWVHFLACMPEESLGFTETHAINLYHTAQTLDELPGTAYEGTSILGGVKALRKLYPSSIQAYHWCFGLDELLVAVSWIGPTVIGIDWHSSMYAPNEKGFLNIDGPVIGGHAIVCTGCDVENKFVRLKNSWSKNWGINGDCFVSFDDMWKLINNSAECCVATGKRALRI